MGRKRTVDLEDHRDVSKLDIIREEVENNRNIVDREKYSRRYLNGAHENEIEELLSTLIPPDGMQYGLLRQSVYAEPDLNRETFMRKSMWTPVPVERHPELQTKDYLGRGSNKGYILHGGLLLCEKPKDYIDEDMKYYLGVTKSELKSLPEMENLNSIEGFIPSFTSDLSTEYTHTGNRSTNRMGSHHSI